MTHIQGAYTGKPIGLDPSQQTDQTNQTQQTSSNRLSRRGNTNSNRVRSNQPSTGSKIWKGITTGLSKAWNSRVAVGSGHTVQGFLGISAFRGAYNRAAGNTDHTTSWYKTQYQPTRKEPASKYDNRSETSRTKDQAKWAGHGATTGIALSVAVGFVPSIVGGILGGVCGGVARLFKGPPLGTKQDLQKIDNSEKSLPGVNLSNGLEKLTNRMADLIGEKTDSVEQGLKMTHEPPANSRFSKFSGDKLPANESVRTYQAYSQHGFDSQFCRENQDFQLGVKLLEKNPSKENFDFVCNNFIIQGNTQEINITSNSRLELASMMERVPNTNNQWRMTDAAYNQLQAAVEAGVNSNEFRNLPEWVRTNLTNGRDARGSNELSMADVFTDASRQIRFLSQATMRNLSHDIG